MTVRSHKKTDHGDTIIRVQNISFRYGSASVLTNVTFDIHAGDYLGIIGPNGGGKTTLLKIMLGLLTPEQGTVTYFGTDIRRFRARHLLGYVPQKAGHVDGQFPATVTEVVGMGLSSGSLTRALRKEKIMAALREVDMASYADRLIGDLSGGQQQRVFIARAIVSKPTILFLDEPTIGIDVQAQEQFYQLLKKLNETHGLTLVLVSHDIDVVATQATELACINNRLIAHGPPHDVDPSAHLKELYGKEMKFILHDH